jgi:ribosomal protein L3
MTGRMRVAEHRKRMEQEGYRLVQMWVPDRANEDYLAQMRRESASINVADQTDDVMEWLDDASGWIWDDQK